jgi:hypothetical protein
MKTYVHLRNNYTDVRVRQKYVPMVAVTNRTRSWHQQRTVRNTCASVRLQWRHFSKKLHRTILHCLENRGTEAKSQDYKAYVIVDRYMVFT